MKKKSLVTLLSIVIFVGITSGVPASGKFDAIISSTDVEKMTGMSGIRQVPQDRKDKFKNGDLNFVTADGRPLLMIEFRPAFAFDAMKADSGYFKAHLSGIGDEAFTSPAFDPQFSVNLRKGRYVAVVTTHIDDAARKKTMLSMEQLIALAKLIAARM